MMITIYLCHNKKVFFACVCKVVLIKTLNKALLKAVLLIAHTQN